MREERSRRDPQRTYLAPLVGAAARTFFASAVLCDAIYTFALSLCILILTRASHTRTVLTPCTHSMELSLLAGCEIGECAPRSHEVPGRRLQTRQQGRE